MIPKYYNLVLSSASLHGAAFIGSLKYLYDMHALQSINTFVGSSAGAIMCFMCVLGFSPEEMYDFCLEHVADKEITSIDFRSVLKVCNSYGLDEGKGVVAIFEAALKHKGFDLDITMLELAKRTGKNLVVCVTNVTKARAEYMSVDTAPEIPVVLALRMTCAIPLVFEPILYNNDLYLDGAVTDGFPYAICQSKLKETLCITASFKVNEIPEGPDVGATRFFSQIFSIFKCTHSKLPSVLNDYTVIEIKCDVDSSLSADIDSINMVTSKQEFQERVDMGYSAVKEFFKV